MELREQLVVVVAALAERDAVIAEVRVRCHPEHCDQGVLLEEFAFRRGVFREPARRW